MFWRMTSDKLPKMASSWNMFFIFEIEMKWKIIFLAQPFWNIFALVFSGRRFKFCLQHLLFRELFNLFDYNIYLLIRFGRICNFSWKIQRKKSIYKIDNSKWNFPNTMCVYRYLHFFHTSSKETLNYQIHLNCNCQKCKTLNIKSYTYKNKNCSKKCKSKNIYMIFRHIKNWP